MSDEQQTEQSVLCMCGERMQQVAYQRTDYRWACPQADNQNYSLHVPKPLPDLSPVDDAWVTFGRVKVDIENETETFERIDPNAAASAQQPSPQSEEIAKQIIERSLKEYHICERTLNDLAKDIATAITRGARSSH